MTSKNINKLTKQGRNLKALLLSEGDTLTAEFYKNKNDEPMVDVGGDFNVKGQMAPGQKAGKMSMRQFLSGASKKEGQDNRDVLMALVNKLKDEGVIDKNEKGLSSESLQKVLNYITKHFSQEDTKPSDITVTRKAPGEKISRALFDEDEISRAKKDEDFKSSARDFLKESYSENPEDFLKDPRDVAVAFADIMRGGDAEMFLIDPHDKGAFFMAMMKQKSGGIRESAEPQKPIKYWYVRMAANIYMGKWYDYRYVAVVAPGRTSREAIQYVRNHKDMYLREIKSWKSGKAKRSYVKQPVEENVFFDKIFGGSEAKDYTTELFDHEYSKYRKENSNESNITEIKKQGKELLKKLTENKQYFENKLAQAAALAITAYFKDGEVLSADQIIKALLKAEDQFDWDLSIDAFSFLRDQIEKNNLEFLNKIPIISREGVTEYKVISSYEDEYDTDLNGVPLAEDPEEAKKAILNSLANITGKKEPISGALKSKKDEEPLEEKIKRLKEADEKKEATQKDNESKQGYLVSKEGNEFQVKGIASNYIYFKTSEEEKANQVAQDMNSAVETK